MSAIFYYTDSINTRSPAFAYPCSDYKSFVQGLCTACGPNGNQCQQTGYHASPNGTLGTLYLMTLNGIKSPHFGMKKRDQNREKNKPHRHIALIKKRLKEKFCLSRFSFQGNT